MKNQHTLLLLLIIISFAACKKKQQNQYSTWIVNNDTFSSNNIDLAIGKAEATFSSINPSNYFRLGFYLDYLPSNGNWLLTNSTGQNPNYAYLSFYYNSQFYIISSNEASYLIASMANNKASYQLSPTWYVNYYNPDDSVLIQGTFNQP